MTKEEVLHQLRELRKRDMAQKGVDFDGLMTADETEALSIAMEIVRNTRPDNSVFKE